MVFDREGFLRKLRSFQAGSPPAPPAVPIAQYARQRALETPSTFAGGSRVYWDSTTGLVTTQVTSHPLYFDPVNNRLTDKQTNIPAIYGMVANSALDESIFRAEERRRTDQSRNALAANVRLDQQVEREREKYRFAPAARGLVPPPTTPEERREQFRQQVLEQSGLRQNAERLTQISSDIRNLNLQRHVGRGGPSSPENAKLLAQITALQQERQSILRSNPEVEELPDLLLPERADQPGSGLINKQLRPVGWLRGIFDFGIRYVHSALGELSERSPLVHLIGRGISATFETAQTGLGLLFRRPPNYSPFALVQNFAVDPTTDRNGAVAAMVLRGWDEDEATREVDALIRGEGQNISAWKFVDARNRTAPIGDKLRELNTLYEEFLADPYHEVVPSGLTLSKSMAATARYNYDQGQIYDTELQEGLAYVTQANQLASYDPTGKEVTRLIDLGLAAIGRAYDALEARTDIPTYNWRYTWILDDDGKALQANAREAVILATAQLGRWPEPWEIELINDPYTNPVAELGGDVLLDPINFIPGAVINRLVIGPAKAIFGVVGRGLLEVRPIRWAYNILKQEAIVSGAGKVSYGLQRAVSSIARAVGDDSNQILRGLQMAGEHLANPAVHTADDLARAGIRQWHLTLLSKAITAMRRQGAELLTEEAALQRITQILRTLTDEVLVSKTDEFVSMGLDAVEAGRRAVAYSSRASNIIRQLPIRLQDEITNGSRLWTNGPLDEGLVSWVARRLKLDVSTVGRFGTRRKLIESMVYLQSAVWRAHVSLLLTARPGFLVWNYLDTASKAILGGANPFASLSRLYNDMPGGFVDEVITGWGAGEGVLLDTGLVRRVLTGEYRPTGILQVMWDTLRETKNPLRALSSGHTFLEASWRTRLYFAHITRQISLVRSLITSRKLELFQQYGIQGALRQAADELSVIYEHNGAGFLQGMEEILTGRRGAASILIPPDLLQAASRVMGETEARTFVREVSKSLREMANVDNLTEASIAKYFDGLRRDVTEEFARIRRAAAETKGTIGDLNKDTTLAAPEVPLEPPIERPVSPIGEAVRETTPSEFLDETQEAIDQTNRRLAGQARLSAEQENVIRVAARQAGEVKASAQRELAELGGELRAEKDALRRAGQSIPDDLDATSDYVTEVSDSISRFTGGIAGRWSREGPLGPLSIQGSGNIPFMIKRWNEHFAYQTKMYQAMTTHVQEITRLLRSGERGELVRRLNAREFASLADLWRATGYEVRIENGILTGLRSPWSYKDYFNTEPWVLQEFLRYNQVNDWANLTARELEEPFITRAMKAIDIAPMQDARALRVRELEQAAEAKAFPEGVPQAENLAGQVAVREAREAAMTPDELAEYRGLRQAEEAAVVPEAPVAQAVQQPQVDDELTQAWDATQTSARLKFAYGNSNLADGTPALSSFESWEDYMQAKIDGAIQKGDEVVAQQLRSRLQRVRQAYRSVLIQHGRADLVEAMLP